MNKIYRKSIKNIILICILINFSYLSYSQYYVYGYENWTVPQYMATDVVILNGGMLNINADIFFNTSNTITVQCGGKLIVNNATLGNAVPNALWGGIIILGNRNLPQTQNNQGYVELNDAILENADCAIKAGEVLKTLTPYGNIYTCTYSGGGIVQAENTHFINNFRSVQIEQYHRNGNKCYFRNCYFEINSGAFFNYYNWNQVPLEFGKTSQIYLHNVNAIRFQGCDFYNFGDIGQSIAIVAYMAGLLINTNDDVYGNLISNNPYYFTSNFSSFAHAIQINESGLNPITILYTYLVNNTYGIVAVNANTLRIESNEIHTGLYGGLYLKNCSKFKIENNFLNNFPSLGMYFYFPQSIPENNYVQYNSFLNCCSPAIGCQGVNSNGINTFSTSTGLQILCNTFQSNYNIDIFLTQDASIAYFQGNPTNAAGNLFLTNTNTSIYNTNYLPFYYYYNLSDPSQIPKNVVNVDAIGGLKFDCSCKDFGFMGINYYSAENNWIGDIEILEDLYIVLKAEYDIKHYEYAMNYTITIDWDAYYNGDTSYQVQVDDFFELTNIQSALDLYCLNAVQILLSAVELDINTYMIWLNRMGCASMDLQIANCFLSLENYSSMDSLLLTLSTKYPYVDSSDINNYKLCLDYLATWDLANVDTLFIPQSDLNTIDSLANLNSGFGSCLAKEILNILNDKVDSIIPLFTCSSIQTTSNFTSNIFEAKSDEFIDVYPNPTENNIQISSTKSDNIINNIIVFTIYGKILINKEYHSNNIIINLNGYSDRLYLVKCVMKDGRTIVKKVIKK
ncbi:MAG: T9SS type A sorting domain-containing protein [Bacteroidales bacterium]|nr:T9SS type A sorting domain-containing protein [Bacteroidales bacterium]